MTAAAAAAAAMQGPTPRSSTALSCLKRPCVLCMLCSPTNAALTAFMASMGFEQGISDLQQRPGLARELLAMHLVLALPPDAQQQLAKGRFAEVPTEAQGLFSRLKVKVTAGGVVVADGQGDAAHALKVLKLQENKTVVILDRVLFSGEGPLQVRLSVCAGVAAW